MTSNYLGAKGDNSAVYTRENKPRTPRINGTKSTFTAYSTDGYFKPRLILAEEFWVGLIQAAAYLGRESVRINGSKTLSAACLSGMLSANAAHALFSIISQTFTAERRALQRRESDLLHEKTENFV